MAQRWDRLISSVGFRRGLMQVNGSFKHALGSAFGLALLAAVPALSQTCGALGSPYGLNGCVVPGQYSAPSVRIQSDPLNPGGFRSTPVAPAPTFNGPMPQG